jgi:hypothetical protein
MLNFCALRPAVPLRIAENAPATPSTARSDAGWRLYKLDGSGPSGADLLHDVQAVRVRYAVDGLPFCGSGVLHLPGPFCAPNSTYIYLIRCYIIYIRIYLIYKKHPRLYVQSGAFCVISVLRLIARRNIVSGHSTRRNGVLCNPSRLFRALSAPFETVGTA